MAAKSYRPVHKGSFAPRLKTGRGARRRSRERNSKTAFDLLADLIGRRDACARDAAQCRVQAQSARRSGDADAADERLADAEAQEAELERLNAAILNLGGTAR